MSVLYHGGVVLVELNPISVASEIPRPLEMQKADVIEGSEDPYYNSPAFLVTKKNGQKRLL